MSLSIHTFPMRGNHTSDQQYNYRQKLLLKLTIWDLVYRLQLEVPKNNYYSYFIIFINF